MTIHGKETGEIRDGRGHAPEIFRRFQELLCDGAVIRSDPKRPDFFELQHSEEVFYFYLSPITGDVLLLAVWGPEHGARPATLDSKLMAWLDCPTRR